MSKQFVLRESKDGGKTWELTAISAHTSMALNDVKNELLEELNNNATNESKYRSVSENTLKNDLGNAIMITERKNEVQYILKKIFWDSDDKTLPKKVVVLRDEPIDENELDEVLGNLLSDTFGFCVNGFFYEIY